MTQTRYDDIGLTYRQRRTPDPEITVQLARYIDDAGTVLNVGAGAGSYEPSSAGVVALEPSSVMIAQRPTGSAPVVQGVAESLPFTDNSLASLGRALREASAWVRSTSARRFLPPI